MLTKDFADFTQEEYQHRLAQLRALMAAAQMDAILLTTDTNHRYFECLQEAMAIIKPGLSISNLVRVVIKKLKASDFTEQAERMSSIDPATGLDILEPPSSLSQTLRSWRRAGSLLLSPRSTPIMVSSCWRKTSWSSTRVTRSSRYRQMRSCRSSDLHDEAR